MRWVKNEPFGARNTLVRKADIYARDRGENVRLFRREWGLRCFSAILGRGEGW